jgi:recombination associated protein RdgC
MWLKQFQAFQISFDFEKNLAPHLSNHMLTPCPAHSRMTHGWKTFSNQQLSQSINGYSMCLFGKEERILPSAVVQNLMEKKVQDLDNARGYPMKRHEKQQLKQDIEFDLLPKAFCIQKKQIILFDSKRQRMYLEATSPQQIEMILAFIHKTIGQSIDISPLAPKEDVVKLWQKWLVNSDALPHYLTLSDKIQWIDSDNQRKQIRCQGYDWEDDSANDWLEKGLLPQEVSFIWRDALQFTLNSKFTFKAIKALPSLQEELDANEIDNEDELTNLLLIGHTYQQLLDDFCDLTKITQSKNASLEMA